MSASENGRRHRQPTSRAQRRTGLLHRTLDGLDLDDDPPAPTCELRVTSSVASRQRPASTTVAIVLVDQSCRCSTEQSRSHSPSELVVTTDSRHAMFGRPAATADSRPACVARLSLQLPPEHGSTARRCRSGSSGSGTRGQQPFDHLNELQVHRLRLFLRRRWSRGRGGGGRLLGGRVGAGVFVVVTAAAEGGDDRDQRRPTSGRRGWACGGVGSSACVASALPRVTGTESDIGHSQPLPPLNRPRNVPRPPRPEETGNVRRSCDRSRPQTSAHVARTVAACARQPGDVSATATRARASTTASSYSGR